MAPHYQMMLKSNIAKYIRSNFGDKYLFAKDYQTKVKGAQEAHEAIRPTNINLEDAGADEGKKSYID